MVLHQGMMTNKQLTKTFIEPIWTDPQTCSKEGPSSLPPLGRGLWQFEAMCQICRGPYSGMQTCQIQKHIDVVWKTIGNLGWKEYIFKIESVLFEFVGACLIFFTYSLALQLSCVLLVLRMFCTRYRLETKEPMFVTRLAAIVIKRGISSVKTRWTFSVRFIKVLYSSSAPFCWIHFTSCWMRHSKSFPWRRHPIRFPEFCIRRLEFMKSWLVAPHRSNPLPRTCTSSSLDFLSSERF